MMRTKGSTRLVLMVLLGGLLSGLAATSHAKRGEDAARDHYVDLVVELLRTHVKAMRWILDNDIKYSDNMVRHSRAFERAFGMIGPMDYHAAEAAALAERLPLEQRLTEQQFEELGERSVKRIQGLSNAAARYLRDHNKQRMRDAINGVINSCSACHVRLPDTTAPPVWQGMKE